jgi:serine/threonine protein phosphatase PrpC
MGNLLGAPVVDKETHVGQTDEFEFGLSSMQGWRVHMEDAHIAEANLHAIVEDEALLKKATAGKKKKGAAAAAASESTDSTAATADGTAKKAKTTIPLPGHSFFGVFDGHGGTFAALYTGDNLCRILSKQPLFVEYALFYQESLTKEFATPAKKAQFLRSGVDYLEGALKQAFVDLDWEIAMAIRGTPHPDANTPYQMPGTSNSASAEHAATGHDSTGGDASTTAKNIADANESIMEAARQAAANQARALDDDGDSGTTACTVLVTPDWLVCANAGDSRAVFSKKLRAVPLSYDHKPDDEGEERRVRAAGGYVAGGRVEGDLAVSRGLGDFRFKNMPTVLSNFSLTTGKPMHPMKAFEGRDLMKPGDQKVSPIPDIILQTRNREQDEFVIVACDGIWDVRSNQECVTEVTNIFKEGESDIGLVCEEVRTRRSGRTRKREAFYIFSSVLVLTRFAIHSFFLFFTDPRLLPSIR